MREIERGERGGLTLGTEACFPFASTLVVEGTIAGCEERAFGVEEVVPF